MSKAPSRTPRTPSRRRIISKPFPRSGELESFHPRYDITLNKEISDIKNKIFINKNKGLNSTHWQKDLDELEQDRVDRAKIHNYIMKIREILYDNELRENEADKLPEADKTRLENDLELLIKFISKTGIFRDIIENKEEGFEVLEDYILNSKAGGRTKRRTFKGKKPKSKRASGSSLKKRKTKRKQRK